MAGGGPTSSSFGAFDDFELFSSPVANRDAYSAADFDIVPQDMFGEYPLSESFVDVQNIRPMPEVIITIPPPRNPISPARPRPASKGQPRRAVFRPFTSFEDVELTVRKLRSAFSQPAERPAMAAGPLAPTRIPSRKQPCSK
jgi:hypothetical protein